MDNKKLAKPTLDEIKAYIEEKSLKVDAEQFFDHYNAKGWIFGLHPMKHWKTILQDWDRYGYGAILADKENLWNELDEELLFFFLEWLDKMPNQGYPKRYHKLKEMAANINRPYFDEITPEITMPGRGFVKMSTAAAFLNVSSDRLDELEAEGFLHSYFINGEQMFPRIELCAVRDRELYQ